MMSVCRVKAFQNAHVAPSARQSRAYTVVVRADNSKTAVTVTKEKINKGGFGELGPIGMTIGASTKDSQQPQGPSLVELGPIGMTLGADRPGSGVGEVSLADSPKIASIHSMTTEEWRAQYEKDGTIDLWVEEEFNAGSRLVGGRAVHKGGAYGYRTGEGVSGGNVAVHKVKIFNHYQNNIVEVEVPEDRYVLWEAEDNGLELPYACRMGCCTACAVRIKEGEMEQPEALGISAELKEQGYALMCVAFPKSDVVMETISEDEIYDLQFGKYFASQALNPDGANIERDDFALEFANMDE